MIRNGVPLIMSHPISPMKTGKHRLHGVSHGLGEAGYDIRLKQQITFHPGSWWRQPRITRVDHQDESVLKMIQEQGLPLSRVKVETFKGRFVLASAYERFNMPTDLVGVVHDKSTWARQGVSVFNTVIEPGWKGYLTLEIVFHGNQPVTLPAGAGIAQVIFHQVAEPASYDGKYQNQENKPVESVWEAHHDKFSS